MSHSETNDKSKAFVLSRIIDGHKADVKCVQSTSEGVLISGGRDDIVKFWAQRGGEYSELTSYQQEKGLVVNSIAYFEGESDWRLFVGRKDGSINVYGSGSPTDTPLTTLRAHDANVCCMFVDDKNEVLLSGSWDKSVIIWPIRQLSRPDFSAFKCVGHSLSVLAVTTIPYSPGYHLSGSADRSIRLWHDDVEVRQYTGHTDVVRALLVLSADRFLSAANDATIRLWHIETGSCLATFCSLKDHYIYSLCLVNDKIVSTGEGGHIEVWSQNNESKEVSLIHEQIINSPAQTQWSVCPLSNGDFATAASDGRVYIFTTNEKRFAPQAVLEMVETEVAARVAKEMEEQEKQAKGTVVIKVALDDGAPNLELRYEKGSDPTIAAEKFISDNGLPISYLNEITEYIKANIPEARAAAAAKMRPQETQRIEVDGTLWDYVFDISVDDGRKCRLCYNSGEDVDFAAQRFVEKYNLPMKFLAKISSFLRDQASGNGAALSNTAGGSGPSNFYDPFTGSGRYVPGESSFSNNVDMADPFTGQGRYVPGMDNSNNAMDVGGDPFTSGGRYVPGSSSSDLVPKSSLPMDKKKPRGELVPVPSYYVFGVEQLSQKAKDKLKEINLKQNAYQLNDYQITALENLMGAQPGSLELSEELISALDMGLQWCIDDLVPILDLFRIALLHEQLNKLFCDVKERGFETHQKLSALLISDPSDPVRILLCRCIANAFSHPWGREMLMQNINDTVTLVAQQTLHVKPAVQLAASSALANWALLLLERSEKVAELGPREDLVRALVKIFETIDSFGGRSEPALIRLLQTLVTLMWGDSSVITLAKSRNIVPIVNRLKDAISDERGKSIARDIVEMTYAV